MNHEDTKRMPAGGREQNRPLIRIYRMRSVTEVGIREKRALNQAILYADRAPDCVIRRPAVFVRALRSAMRMSQSQLARRALVPKSHIARLESGRIDPKYSTIERLFAAMFCEIVLVPKARIRPSEAVARRRLEQPRWAWRVWNEAAKY